MNRISGRVILKESGAAIPDVLVVIYDLDPRTRPEELIEAAASRSVPPESLSGGDRLGSVLTAKDGNFELVYEDSEFQIRNPNERYWHRKNRAKVWRRVCCLSRALFDKTRARLSNTSSGSRRSD
jgi:hypothetical protein